MTWMDQVILVDEFDNARGSMDKMEAHQKGILHRAFSIQLINSRGELLLQKRAHSKYHSGGLWTNTCCSHQHPQQPPEQTIQQRLMDEMGINTPLTFAYKFIYKTDLDHQLIEYEWDHVYIGYFDGIPVLNREEAEDWKLVRLDQLILDINSDPQQYTFWFKLIAQHPMIHEFARQVH